MIPALRHFGLVSVVLLFAMNSLAADKLLYNFQTATNTATWQIVNDDVMGGVSASTFRLTNGVALFRVWPK